METHIYRICRGTGRYVCVCVCVIRDNYQILYTTNRLVAVKHTSTLHISAYRKNHRSRLHFARNIFTALYDWVAGEGGWGMHKGGYQVGD